MKKIYFLFLTLIIAASCSTSHKSQVTHTAADTTAPASSKRPLEEFHAASTRSIDILHTKLEVSFDWEKQYLNGKAIITLKPYFYPAKEITLDAKGFEIKEEIFFI